MFEAYAEAGGNFIDTANFYTKGESESFLGEFIHGERDRWVIATKYSLDMSGCGEVNASGNHRKNMMQSVEASLRRLKTDYIDLLWLHVWDFTTPIEEIMRGFDDLVRQGKVLYAGISDTPAGLWQQPILWHSFGAGRHLLDYKLSTLCVNERPNASYFQWRLTSTLASQPGAHWVEVC